MTDNPAPWTMDRKRTRYPRFDEDRHDLAACRGFMWSILIGMVFWCAIIAFFCALGWLPWPWQWWSKDAQRAQVERHWAMVARDSEPFPQAVKWERGKTKP